MDTTCTLELNYKKMHLMAQCCVSGIAAATEQKDKVKLMDGLASDAKDYLVEYYAKRITQIDTVLYKVQSWLTSNTDNKKPFEDLTTPFHR